MSDLANSVEMLETGLGKISDYLDVVGTEILLDREDRAKDAALCSVSLRNALTCENWATAKQAVEGLEALISTWGAVDKAAHVRGVYLAKAQNEIEVVRGGIPVLNMRVERFINTLNESRDRSEAVAPTLLRQISEMKAQLAEANARFERLCEHRLHHEHVRERVWAMTGGKCFYCHVELLKDSTCEGNPRHVFEVDHLVPKSLGGPDHLANFVPACAGCNGEKSNKPFVEFYMARRPAPVLSIVEAPAA